MLTSRVPVFIRGIIVHVEMFRTDDSSVLGTFDIEGDEFVFKYNKKDKARPVSIKELHGLSFNALCGSMAGNIHGSEEYDVMDAVELHSSNILEGLKDHKFDFKEVYAFDSMCSNFGVEFKIEELTKLMYPFHGSYNPSKANEYIQRIVRSMGETVENPLVSLGYLTELSGNGYDYSGLKSAESAEQYIAKEAVKAYLSTTY